MNKMNAVKFLLFLIPIFLFSCASREKIAYYQNIDQVLGSDSSVSFNTKLQPDDLLMIVVMAETQEAAAPFNLPSLLTQSTTELDNQQLRISSYLIDVNGDIQFPVIGSIHLGGLTRAEANAKLVEVLKKYITDPKINLRILNYKVTVSGEVLQPGIKTISSERITLIEVLAMSGDLTPYGKRDNIMIIREKDGKKEIGRVDITKADFINSPYYYLSQNDHVYVEPNKTKVNASAVGPNTGIIISAISLLLTVVALIIR
ncbi:polysaccharide biosynthesis/export family protein [Flavobacterium qiangtangense]|uniref:Polysaccharide biosynthesis/export family protein n=1 Tax=Flavobacterium qiangtangense TaxID=1442595 RepID=A0ABW1PSR4_9FLAO